MMKKLQTFNIGESPQAGMYRDMLQQEGIACLLKNDGLTGAIGELPFVECFPELWIVDEETYPRARMLLDGWLAQKALADAPDWRCPVCGEHCGCHFELCWNCSRPRS